MPATALTTRLLHSDPTRAAWIDGPIATITLNRPQAFNSINLADRAEARSSSRAEVEANGDIRVPRSSRAKAVPSAPAAICRRSAPPPRPAPSRRWSANSRKHYPFSSTQCGGCQDRLCRACTARRPAPAWGSRSSPISASPRKTQNSGRLPPRSHCRRTAAPPSVFSGTVGVAPRAADIPGGGHLHRSTGATNGGWSPR